MTDRIAAIRSTWAPRTPGVWGPAPVDVRPQYTGTEGEPRAQAAAVLPRGHGDARARTVTDDRVVGAR